MTVELFFSMLGAVGIPLLVFVFWLSGILTTLRENQKNLKTSLTGSLRLMMSDERVNQEKRFDEIDKIVHELDKEVQSVRHNSNNIDMRVRKLEGRL